MAKESPARLHATEKAKSNRWRLYPRLRYTGQRLGTRMRPRKGLARRLGRRPSKDMGLGRRPGRDMGLARRLGRRRPGRRLGRRQLDNLN